MECLGSSLGSDGFFSKKWALERVTMTVSLEERELDRRMGRTSLAMGVKVYRTGSVGKR